MSNKENNMKKTKFLFIVVVVLLCATLAACLVACGNTNDETTKEDPPAPKLPTAAQVITARKAAAQSENQNYDFHINLNGNLQVSIFNGSANANYDGQYRYNSATDELSFKRVTSGAVLYDSQEYIVDEGNSRIKIKTNEDGIVKKVAVRQADDDGLTLINLPFVALIDALEAENLTNIALSTGDYKYQANMVLTAENPALNKLYQTIGRMDTDISLKDVSFTNPASGVLLKFNLEDGGKLTDFTFSAQIKFPVKGVDVTLTLTYSQKGNDAAIYVPAYDKLLYGETKVAPELTAITNAFAAAKAKTAYSLDLYAENDFDPGWNVKATVDKYTARMYKNTMTVDDASFEAFNKSYKYRNHTETDGNESYKFTEGNVTSDGNVWLIHRKGTNQQENLGATKTASSTFDEMTAYFMLAASDVDCIEKTQKSGETTLDIHINEAKSIALIKSIVALINSNPTHDTGVIKAENYLNESEYTVEDASFTVTMANGQLKSITFESELIYTPTSGDYSENHITLKNTLTLDFDKELEDAQKYKAPENATTNFTGLNASKFYIL